MNQRAAKVIRTLKDRTQSLGVAESLTGGLIGATLTSVPGSSAVFLGGVTSYANRLKTDLLGIPADTLRQHTEVSEEVAIGMANGLQLKTHADWVIAVTGVAGPDAQEGHAPGEVWICVVGPRTPSVPHTNHVRQFQFDGDRDAVRTQTVDAAFDMLLRLVSPV